MHTLFSALLASIFALGALASDSLTLPTLVDRDVEPEDFDKRSSSGGGILQMAAVAQVLHKQSNGLSGTYTFTNVATGSSLTWDGGLSLYPGSKATALTLVTGIEGVRISTPSGNKCLSAQWGGSFDWAGVLYACQVGPGKSGGGLTPAKQWWLLVPAAPPQSAAKKASRTMTVKAKSHAKHRTNRKTHHVTHKSHHSSHKGRGHRHHRREEVVDLWARDLADSTLEKRSGSTYYIIPTDHIDNMETRALTAKRVSTDGNMSSVLSQFVDGDTAQMWTITPA